MKKKNMNAVNLGKLGGQARAKNLTAEERSESARIAAKARWPDAPRCPCGDNTLHRARLRAFDCCKKATKNRRQIMAAVAKLRGVATSSSTS